MLGMRAGDSFYCSPGHGRRNRNRGRGPRSRPSGSSKGSLYQRRAGILSGSTGVVRGVSGGLTVTSVSTKVTVEPGVSGS
jgi:hypothetical protein